MIFSLYLENLLKSFSVAANVPHREVLEKAVGVDTKQSSLNGMPRFMKQLRDSNEVVKQYNVRKKLVIAVSKAEKKSLAIVHKRLF